MNREPAPTLRYCRSCGTPSRERVRPLERVGTTYQIVVACAACATSFVVVARN